MSQSEKYTGQQDIDALLDEKVAALIESTTTKLLGLRVEELNKDLTAKLIHSSFMDYAVDLNISFKQAKKSFKKYYLQKMLLLNLGNISEVAKRAGINRRSLHRLIGDLGIDVTKIKKDLIKPYDIKVNSVSSVIEKTLDTYKSIFHPEKLQAMYKSVNIISQDVVNELPETRLTLKNAVEDFELRYFQQALLEQKNNIAAISKRCKLRYETLHRKLKKLGLI